MVKTSRVTFNQLGQVEVPKDIPRKHALILKAVLTALNLLPMTIYLIVVSVHVQSERNSGQVCVFKDGTGGAIPCYVDAKLDFEHYSNSLQLLMGPLMHNKIDWKVTCIQDKLISKDFEFIDQDSVRRSRVIQAQSKVSRGYNYDSSPVYTPAGTNCYYEKVISVANIALIQFVEIILIGVIIFFFVGNGLASAGEAPMFISLVALVMNIEILAIPIAFIIFMVSNLIIYVYHRFVPRTITVLTPSKDTEEATVL